MRLHDCECGVPLPCKRCREIDGFAMAAEIIAELRVHDSLDINALSRIIGTAPETVQRAVTRMIAEGRVWRADEGEGKVTRYVYRLGRSFEQDDGSAWVGDVPKKVYSIVDHETLTANLQPRYLIWEGTHVVSGPLLDAKFPGRRFQRRSEARAFYETKFEVVDSIRVPAPRYIFRVRPKESYDEQKSSH